MYWAGPAFGGILAAIVYNLAFRGDHKKSNQPNNTGPTAVPLIPVTNKELKHLEMEA